MITRIERDLITLSVDSLLQLCREFKNERTLDPRYFSMNVTYTIECLQNHMGLRVLTLPELVYTSPLSKEKVTNLFTLLPLDTAYLLTRNVIEERHNPFPLRVISINRFGQVVSSSCNLSTAVVLKMK